MFARLYAVAIVIFFAIDMVWLGVIAKNFYQNQIGSLIKADVNWIAALLFYALFVAGLVVFVITPAIEKHSWVHALVFGAFFGLVSYATYDLTNLALTKNWPLLVTVVDLIWGATLSASVSTLTYLVVTALWL